ncbi:MULTISPECIES: SIMPL domain-containing protein [Anaeromyxobacter]|uniref:SIMPL domain-containing protein n=1 Tax=Anaeromyxobacter TaxID=161492 RepID=UPI001F57EFC6|nr:MULTISPECIES: SIMPL domain-containing protein [unclassified Anaeromyxobacter]
MSTTRPLALLLLVPLGCATRAAAAQVPAPAAQSVLAASPAVEVRSLDRTLRVTGEGRVRVRPDVAVVLAGIEATGKTLAPTVADAAAKMRRMIDALAKAGVAEKDVQTTRHDVQVERPWVDGKPRDITGYTVVDEVRVTVRDLAKLGQILERVVAAGSNSLRGLTFERDDPAPQRQEALANAVAVARAKAEAMAKAAGVSLGAVVAIEEGAAERPIPLAKYRTQAMVATDGAPVTPGELEIDASVSVTYAIR